MSGLTGGFLGGIAQGVGQGMVNVSKGEMDREKMAELKAEANHRRQMRPMEMQQARGQVEQQSIQISELNKQIKKRDIMIMQDKSFSYLDSYFRGDDKGDEEYLNAGIVQNPDINKMIANSKELNINLGQITNVTDNDNGTLTLKNSITGKEKTLPTQLLLTSLGYFTRRDAVEIKESEKEFLSEKRRWDLNKLKAETSKNIAQANKANRPEASGNDGYDLKDLLYIQEKQLSIAGKESEADTSNMIKEVDSLASEGKDTEVYDKVTSNTNLYQKVFPTQTDRNQVKDGRTALRLGIGLKDLQAELDKAIDNKDVGGLPNMMVNYFSKYGIGTQSTVARAALAEALTTKGEAITADQLKLITGAAFNETEMQIKLKPLISAMQGYDGSNVAKAKFKAAMTEWDRTASNYISTLPKSHQSYVKGSLRTKPKSDKKDTQPMSFTFGGREFMVGDQQKTKSGKIATLGPDGKWVTK